jgi:Saxitoxin biosynthesis operon protein SxtJ
MRPKNIGISQLRSFGLVVGAGFAVIALWPLVFRGVGPRTWALIISLTLSGIALLFPRALKPVHRAWMMIGETLGWVNSRIILSVVYYLLIVPIGAVRRLGGTDPMKRRLEPDALTYRTARVKRAADHMRRQY